MTKHKDHEEFKDTEIGKIPKDWEVVRLGNIIKDILTGATPLRSNKEYWVNGNIPWLTNEEVEDGKINYIWDTKEKVTEKALRETNIKLIPEDSVILSLTASVGKVAVNKIPITTNQQFNSLIFKENVSTKFLAYYLLFSKKKIEQLGGLTTFKFIGKETIKKLPVACPPLPEQKAIANLLSTVDSAIQKSDEAIAKTEQLKKGLIQELFENKNWKQESLSNDDKFNLIMGQSPPSNTYNENNEGLPFYQGNAEFGIFYPNPRVYCNSPIKIAKEGDILISVRAPVGELNMADRKSCIGRGLAAIRVKKGINFFYFYFLNYIKQRIKALGQGSTFKAITGKELKNLKVPVPDIEEQQKIAEILSTVDKRLELEKQKKEKFERIKKGLMNDLLTGKKRIKFNNEVS